MSKDDDRSFSYFAKFDLYMSLLNELLTYPPGDAKQTTAHEGLLAKRLCAILAEYQEQSYLLDPYLEKMTLPLLVRFKQRVVDVVDRGVTSEEKWWLAEVTYNLVKTRGAKTVSGLFPHSTSDLRLVLEYLNSKDTSNTMSWDVRYITLLWLSLVVRLPFDLAQFDKDSPGTTFHTIESIGKRFIARAGLDRETGALVLARLYARKDCTAYFRPFVSWAIESLHAKPENLLAIGTLQVLCERARSGNDVSKEDLAPMRELLQCVEAYDTLTSNMLVRKWKVKLTGRMALCELPSRPAYTMRRKNLMADEATQRTAVNSDPDIEIPPTVELVIEELLNALQDRDTVVRYSAAKGIARVAERLPMEYSAEILDSVMALFSIHEIQGEGGVQDLPATAEATWHGATLACAEIARRGLVSTLHLGTLLNWMKKGLYFDVRKGAHSIGSNVRDAVAYVLWALARTSDKESFRPHSLDVARRLVSAALFDREVHVRRAASAAFQEHVGRMSLFPHGIDVIRVADYFSVSIKRLAFTVAAPQVAEFEEYRDFLIQHIVKISLKHWDPTIRQSAAISLRRICELNLPALGPVCMEHAVRLARSFDSNDTHGGLTLLAELADAFRTATFAEAQSLRLRVFTDLVGLPPSVFNRYRNDLILQAACQTIATSLCKEALEASNTPTKWRDLVDSGIKSRDVAVQDAASAAMRSATLLIGCKDDVPSTLIADFAKPNPVVQQFVTKTLGVLAYGSDPEPSRDAIKCLLEAVDVKSTSFVKPIEPRQNAYESLPKILQELGPAITTVITPTVAQSILRALILGLTDYTTDQRGDVGSWVRMASIRGIVDIVILLFDLAKNLHPLDAWLPPTVLQTAIAGILRQAAERLDNVRLVATEQLIRLIQRGPPNIPKGSQWDIPGNQILHLELIQGADEMQSWSDGAWLFPKVVRLLSVPEYQSELLMGFILSIGSRGERATHPGSTSLTAYAVQLPDADLLHLLDGILDIGKKNATANAIFVPVIHTYDVLLEGGVLQRVCALTDGYPRLTEILTLVSRNVDKLKSADRVLATSKLVCGMAGLNSFGVFAIDKLPLFLGHKLPKVRSSTAEALYMVLQGSDLDVDESVEELLLQTTWTEDANGQQNAIETITAGLMEAAKLAE